MPSYRQLNGVNNTGNGVNNPGNGGNQPGNGGSNTGGNNPGGNKPEGINPGGNNTGGNSTGGNSPGGNSPGGKSPGGNNPGENNPGGNNPGGNNTVQLVLNQLRAHHRSPKVEDKYEEEAIEATNELCEYDNGHDSGPNAAKSNLWASVGACSSDQELFELLVCLLNFWLHEFSLKLEFFYNAI